MLTGGVPHAAASRLQHIAAHMKDTISSTCAAAAPTAAGGDSVVLPALTHRGKTMGQLGVLRSSSGCTVAEQQRRLAEDGYLFLPQALGRARVMAAREEILSRVSSVSGDLLLPDGRLNPDGLGSRDPLWSDAWHVQNVVVGNNALNDVLFGGQMMEIYEALFSEPAAHLDYRWLRVKDPGNVHPTPPHCDLVYMGRGSHRLFTSWTPFTDHGFETGGLMLLEGSHRAATAGAKALHGGDMSELADYELTLGRYVLSDVDSHCDDAESMAIIQTANKEGRELTADEKATIARIGGDGSQMFSMGDDAQEAQRRIGIGGRWLTADYQIGDLLIFSTCDTLHASYHHRLVVDHVCCIASEVLHQ